MKLHNQLREGTYRQHPAQTALVYGIQPIFEKEFHAKSFGFRPHRGSREALREVEHLLKKGYEWIADVDLKGYFDTQGFCDSRRGELEELPSPCFEIMRGFGLTGHWRWKMSELFLAGGHLSLYQVFSAN